MYLFTDSFFEPYSLKVVIIGGHFEWNISLSSHVTHIIPMCNLALTCKRRILSLEHGGTNAKFFLFVLSGFWHWRTREWSLSLLHVKLKLCYLPNNVQFATLILLNIFAWLTALPFLFFSAEQLKDIGCTWVIHGHSERRHIIGENDEVKV